MSQSLGREDERKPSLRREKHVQRPYGRKTQCAENFRPAVLPYGREPGTGCGLDHTDLEVMIMVSSFNLRAMDNYKSRE